MINKKQLYLSILSCLIAILIFVFNKPQQVVQISLNSLNKVRNDNFNSQSIYDLTSVYRNVSTFVKYYYIPNLRTSDKSMVGINIEPELRFIDDVYDQIPHFFDALNARKIKELLNKINYFDLDLSEIKDEKTKEKMISYFTHFNFNMGEEKILDPLNSKVIGSVIKINYQSTEKISLADTKIINDIIEKNLTLDFIDKFNEKVNQIYALAKEEIYLPSIRKAESNNTLDNLNQNLSGKIFEKFSEEKFKRNNLINELKFDFSRIEKDIIKYQKNYKRLKNLRIINKTKTKIVIHRGVFNEKTFFILLGILLITVNLLIFVSLNPELRNKTLSKINYFFK